MFNIFNKKETEKENNISLIAVASLLIHSAKIDENYTIKEKSIIERTLIELGVDKEKLDQLMINAEKNEKNSK